MAVADRTKPVEDLLDQVSMIEVQMSQAPPPPGLDPLADLEEELKAIVVSWTWLD